MPSSSFFYTGATSSLDIPTYLYAEIPPVGTVGDIIRITDRQGRLAVSDGTYWRYTNGWKLALDTSRNRTETTGSLTWTWDTDERLWFWSNAISQTGNISITIAGTIPDGISFEFHGPGIPNGYTFSVNGILMTVEQWIRLVSINGTIVSAGRLTD